MPTSDSHQNKTTFINRDRIVQANTTQTPYEVRRENGWLIVPVVMMTEGVHHGGAGPILHLEEYYTQEVEAWNDTPVTVHHPENEDGVHVSVQAVDENRWVIGHLRNARAEDGKLKADVYIREQRALAVNPDVLNYLNEGKPLDVSVGAFTKDRPETGTFSGADYEAVTLAYGPDHLALLPGGQGACGWQDGCGIRTNETTDIMTLQTNVTFDGTESLKWETPGLCAFNVNKKQWADLSQSEKEKISNYFLIGGPEAGAFEDLALPIVNPQTDQLNENALRNVIGGQGVSEDIIANESYQKAQQQAFQLLNSEFGADLAIPSFSDLQSTEYEVISKSGFYGLVTNQLQSNEAGFMELSRRIQSKLDRMDSELRIHFLEELFDGFFIFRRRNTDTGTTKFFRQSFEQNTNEEVVFTDDPVEVRKEVEFIPIQSNTSGSGNEIQRTKFTNNTNIKEDHMSTKKEQKKETSTSPSGEVMEKVVGLINNERSRFTKSDRPWLLQLNQDQLDQLEPTPLPSKEEQRKQAIQVLQEDLSDVEKLKEIVPEKISKRIDIGLTAYGKEREKLTSTIQDNTSKEDWPEDVLEDMNIDNLRRLAKSVRKADYSAQGPVTNRKNGNSIPEGSGGVLYPAGVGIEN